MSVVTSWAVPALVAGLLLGTPPQDPDPSRLYGRVITAGGEVFEGYIRWDRNEGAWSDLVRGAKEMSRRNLRDARRMGSGPARPREREVSFLGFSFSWSDDDRWPQTASSGVRFGHLRSIEVLGDDRALLVLKSGDEVELESSATDLGRGIRSIVVEDGVAGPVELRWRDLELIDFAAAPDGLASEAGRRLFGTVSTRDGQRFRGHVAWDNDEILESDILDGEERGVDRKIPFDRIVAIERRGTSSARVLLVDDTEVLLRDSNDVDSGNRGIVVADAALGEVLVPWREFERFDLELPPLHAAEYGSFDGGWPLVGTVVLSDGTELEGGIRWDNDEEYSWEILDGESRDIEFDIEFAQIDRIERRSSSRSMVRLLDGREFELSGSNDVDSGNKGIFVTTSTGLELVEWSEFRELRLRRP